MKKVLENIKKNFLLYLVSLFVSISFWNTVITSITKPEKEEKIVFLLDSNITDYSAFSSLKEECELSNILEIEYLKPYSNDLLGAYYSSYFEGEFDLVILEENNVESFLNDYSSSFLTLDNNGYEYYTYNESIIGAKVSDEYISGNYYVFICKDSIHLDDTDSYALKIFNEIAEVK